MIMQLSA